MTRAAVRELVAHGAVVGAVPARNAAWLAVVCALTGWTPEEAARQPSWMVEMVMEAHRALGQATMEQLGQATPAAGPYTDELTKKLIESRPPMPAPDPKNIKLFPEEDAWPKSEKSGGSRPRTT